MKIVKKVFADAIKEVLAGMKGRIQESSPYSVIKCQYVGGSLQMVAMASASAGMHGMHSVSIPAESEAISIFYLSREKVNLFLKADKSKEVSLNITVDEKGVPTVMANDFTDIASKEVDAFHFVDEAYQKFFNDRSETATTVLPKKVYDDVVNHVVPHVAQDETRYFMNGVALVSREGWLRFVATDGRSMAILDTICAAEGIKNPYPILLPCLFPKRSGDNTVYLERGDKISSTVWFSDKDETYTRVYMNIDGQFPNYERVIPESQSDTATFDTEEIRGMLNTLAAMETKKSWRKLYFTLSTAEDGKEIITIERRGDKGVVLQSLSTKNPVTFTTAMSFCFNPDYLIKSLGESSVTTMQYTHRMKAISIQDGSLLSIYMPMAME